MESKIIIIVVVIDFLYLSTFVMLLLSPLPLRYALLLCYPVMLQLMFPDLLHFRYAKLILQGYTERGKVLLLLHRLLIFSRSVSGMKSWCRSVRVEVVIPDFGT